LVILNKGNQALGEKDSEKVEKTGKYFFCGIVSSMVTLEKHMTALDIYACAYLAAFLRRCCCFQPAHAPGNSLCIYRKDSATFPLRKQTQSTAVYCV